MFSRVDEKSLNQRVKKERLSAILAIFLLSAICYPLSAETVDTVKLKILVANPENSAEEVVPVKMSLPKGIKPEDIIDIGDFKLGYDDEKDSYYIYQELTLPPGESQSFEVKIKDIWLISQEKLDFLKGYTEKLRDMLKDTEYSKNAEELAQRSLEGIQEIEKEQKRSSSLSVEKRMENYQFNLQKLEEIKDDIASLENLVIAGGGTVGVRIKDEAIGVVALEKDRMASSPYPDGIITLRIEMKNPYSDRENVLPLKYYLPKEVRPEYVMDKAGLEIGYDFDRGLPYLYDEEVKLGPDENKTWEVKIKDVWNIPQAVLDGLREHTQKLVYTLQGTPSYEQAKFLSEDIYKRLAVIVSSQDNKGLSPQEHIALYRANSKSLTEVKKEVADLEKLTLQAGLIPGITLAKAKGKVGGAGEDKVGSGGEGGTGGGEAIRGVKGLKLLAQSIFKGKAPSGTTTWKIIFAIIGFVGMVSLIFFLVWTAQVKKERKVEKIGEELQKGK